MPVGLLDSRLDAYWDQGGSATSSLVPAPYLVSINGHLYTEDLEFKPWKRQAFRATTAQITRTQADTSNEPGEQSLSTQSLWRRTQDSWHLGAGQVYLDRKNSTEFSFRASKGVNVWTQWQITLLFDTTQALASANTNLGLAVCGTHLYLIDGQTLKYTSDGVTWTTVTGTPAATASSICSDGHNVYVTYGASGMYTTTEAAASASQLVTSALASTAVCRFVLGRLMIGNNNALYNITSTVAAALPAALLTSNYSNLVWVDLTAGNGVIFAAANSGNVGLVYSIQINTDATALTAPILCAQLPGGETVNAIYGYAGSGVSIGTSKGFRFSEQALANGVAGTVALTIGPLFNLPNPVLCFSGFDRFIWGGYGNYDTTSTGLFRMDPSQFIADLAPAYASDLMATTQGAINSVVHFNGTPVFSVSGVGVYFQATTYVASGTIDSGLITYGLADNKMPVFVDLQTLPLLANTSVTTSVALDGGSFTALGTAQAVGHPFQEFSTPQTLAGTIEIRETLTSNSPNTSTPTVVRHTLRAIPAAIAPTDWTVVVQLRERDTINGIEVPLVPSLEYAYLDSLRIFKTISLLQIGNNGPYTVTIEDIDYIPEQRGSSTGEINGVAVITARTVV